MKSKVLWNRRAISSVLSNILMMLIAVAGMSIAITATYVITGNLHDTMGERFIVEDVWFKTDEIDIYIRNVGKIPIKIAAVYVNYTSQSFGSLELDVGSNGWLYVTHSCSSNSAYFINVVTTRGTQVADWYRTPT